MLRLREEIVGFLRSHGSSCNGDVEPNQFFLLLVWHALAKMTADVDPHLPNILSEGDLQASNPRFYVLEFGMP